MIFQRTRPAATRQPGQAQNGYSLIELMFVAGIIATVGGLAVPQLFTALDEWRALSAVRYLSTRLQQTRMDAVLRSANTALRIVADGTSYRYAVYVDGNRNGVRSVDIERGIDRAIHAEERLRDQFPGVDFGTLPGLPSVDGSSPPPGADPVRLGTGDMAVFDPFGTSTTGSLYVRCRNVQYVIRVVGETGKTRLLKFDARGQIWRSL